MRTAVRVAVVTGASSGIGAAFVKCLANDGWTVLAAARNRERLEAVAKGAAQTPGCVHVVCVDLESGGGARALEQRARDLGGTDLLVNCAGLFGYGAFADGDAESFASIVRVNCEGLVRTTLAFLPQLTAREGSRILNVGSLAGFQPGPSFAVYAASKAFVLSFSEALTVELGDRVGVTVLCPGPVTTPIFDRGAPGVPRKRVRHEMSPDAVARAGLRAVERGVSVAVPGFLNGVMAWLAGIAPRGLARRYSSSIGGAYLGLPKVRPGAR